MEVLKTNNTTESLWLHAPNQPKLVLPWWLTDSSASPDEVDTGAPHFTSEGAAWSQSWDQHFLLQNIASTSNKDSFYSYCHLTTIFNIQLTNCFRTIQKWLKGTRLSPSSDPGLTATLLRQKGEGLIQKLTFPNDS